MRILVVSSNFYPDIFAINNIVEKLVQRGHEMTVLTGLPDYTTSIIPKEYKYGKNRFQNFKGAEVIRVNTIARRHGSIWRSLNYLSFVYNASVLTKYGKWGKPYDIVYVWQVSPVTQIIPAVIFGKRFHIPVYVYCMDIWPECVKAMGFKEGTLFYKVIHSISRKAYEKVDHIAVSSKPFAHYLEYVNGIDITKISYLPQYGPQWMLEENYTKERKLDSNVNFLFIGNIGKAQKLETLLKAAFIAATKLKKSKNIFEITIAGSGSDIDNCRSLVKQLKIENIIHFVGSVPFNKTKELYQNADCCVFTLDGSNRIGDTLPGKVQTYMAAGKPIIASCNGAGKEVIEESGCGIAVPANNQKALAKALVEFILNPKRFADCARKSREYFKKHFLEAVFFEQLEMEMSNLINGSMENV